MQQGNGAKHIGKAMERREALPQVSKASIYRARTKILEEDCKNYSRDFQKIAAWCDAWNDSNNGYASMDVDENGHFSSVTVYSSAAFCRMVNGQRIFGVDGAHFKHTIYKGVLLAVEGRDANGKNVLAAFKICDLENQENYASFFADLNSGNIDVEDGLTLEAWLNSDNTGMINDRQKGLQAAGDSEFPHTAKRICGKHHCDNARKPTNAGPRGWSNQDFWNLQKQITEASYKEQLEKLKAKSAQAAEYFDGTDHDLWTHSKLVESGVKMYGWSTSNFVESEDSRLLPARHEAPYGALVKIGVTMAAETALARESAAKMVDAKKLLTPYAEKHYIMQTRLSRSCTVQRLDEKIALVKTCIGQNIHERTVDFSKKECTCSEWQQTGMPCRHAIAFAPQVFRDLASNPARWVNFAFDKCYLVEEYAKATAGIIIPPNPEALGLDKITKAPTAIKAAGRPRKKRIRSVADHNGMTASGAPLRVYRCKRCGQAGHNTLTCTQAPMVVDLTTSP